MKQSVSKELGTSGLVFVVLLLCSEKYAWGLISQAQPAPAGAGNPEPTVHGCWSWPQVKASSLERGGRSLQLRLPFLELKMPQR